MICSNPFVTVGSAFPCGACVACRINRAKLWKHRIMLEGLCHSENCFLTLTYMDEKLPVLTGKSTGQILGTLRPKDLQDWLKRLRKKMQPLKMRFYACGEYGSRTWRPHYHVVLFGFPTCRRGRTKRDGVTGRVVPNECCEWCDTIATSWGLGDVELGEFNETTSGYVSDYVIKKLTRPSDIQLDGRFPEFARMSLRPGIGGNAVDQIVRVLGPANGVIQDVPLVLKHGVKNFPLGRYLRSKIREGLGRERGCPDALLLAYQEDMRDLREAAKASSDDPSFKKHLVRSFEGSVLHMEALNELYNRKKGAL